MPNENTELRSEAVQNIIGYIPHWIIRWGITVIFLIVLVLLVGSWFFKYPDVIAATIVVTTEPPPASIVAKSNGKIANLLIQNNQAVHTNDELAVIDNPANYHHVIALKARLETFKLVPPFNESQQLVGTYTLGELQPAYTRLNRAYADYQIFLELDYHQQKIKAIEKLFEKRQPLITKAESDADKLQIQVAELQKSILDLQLQYQQQQRQLQLGLTEAYGNLINQIESWEYRYVLKSPLDGTVTFTKYWTVNQQVKAGSVVMTVVPEILMAKKIGKVRLPIQGAGKVQTGQPVIIKFANYPFMEYGTVNGVIKQISQIPFESHYVVEVELANELVTNYGEKLDFKPQMQGTAEIITEEIRLLERFFKPILSIFKKQM